MQFIGEHLLPGKIGHFFALLFFSASLVAVIAYFKAANAKMPEEEKGQTGKGNPVSLSLEWPHILKGKSGNLRRA